MFLSAATVALAQSNIHELNGRVGIGTPAPAAKLDVNGDLKAIQIGAGRHVYSNWPLIVQGFASGFIEPNGQNAVTILPAYSGFNYVVSDYFSGTTHLPLVLSGRGTTHDLVLGTSGNIGVGTSSPRARLDVAGEVRAGALRSTQIGVILKQDGPTLGWDDQSYILNWGWDSTYGDYIDLGWGGSGTVTAPLRVSEVQGVVTFGQTLLASDGGNVGIGTKNPSHKLSVNGTGKFRELIVESTGWSDYVFTPDYDLQPLSEVEAHIKEHQHLPGIPSATEVAEQGVSVGEMQAKLLAKIEELTLHVIAQQKELSLVKEQNAGLRAEVRDLKANLLSR